MNKVCIGSTLYELKKQEVKSQASGQVLGYIDTCDRFWFYIHTNRGESVLCNGKMVTTNRYGRPTVTFLSV